MITRKFLSKLIPALPMLLAAALVILVTVIFLTAMRSKAHAQFGAIEQPMFQLTSTAGSFPGPQTIQGLAYYWNSSDLLTNAIVTNWIDRIQGVVLTNGNLTVRPTNSMSGVGFDGNTFLTNETVTFSGHSTETIWVVLNRTTGVGIRAILGNTGGNGYYFDGVGAAIPAGNWGYSKASALSLSKPIATNNFQTLLMNHTNGQTAWNYTNNVLSVGIANGSWEAITMRGVANKTSQRLVGFIAEIAFYTNGLTVTDRQTLEYYATNTYGYVPY